MDNIDLINDDWYLEKEGLNPTCFVPLFLLWWHKVNDNYWSQMSRGKIHHSLYCDLHSMIKYWLQILEAWLNINHLRHFNFFGPQPNLLEWFNVGHQWNGGDKILTIYVDIMIIYALLICGAWSNHDHSLYSLFYWFLMKSRSERIQIVDLMGTMKSRAPTLFSFLDNTKNIQP